MLNIIGVGIAFITIIILIRKQINFGISLIFGSLIVGIFSLQIIQPLDIPRAIIEASFYSFENNSIVTGTSELALLLLFIYILAKLMQETGAITKLIESLRSFFSKGGILGLIPAVYGLMPVPGGALFSAPMINEEGDKYKLNKNQKNFLNVWFRHIWFPIYPISSAMILICRPEFSNIDIYNLVVVNIPAFLFSACIGFIFLKKMIKTTTQKTETTKRNIRGLIYLIPPILPIAFYGVLHFLGFSEIRSFLFGVIFSIVLMFMVTKITFNEYILIIKKSLAWKLVLAIFGIMIFREMIEISQASTVLIEAIQNIPIPPIIIVIIIPLLLGVLTGYNLGAIALSYPLVEPFFFLIEIGIIGLTSIIFISSLVGYLISPIHLCNVLSSDYLKTDTTRMYRMFIPAAFALLILNTALMMVLL